MEIKNLKPRSGFDTLRMGDSDELVVMENFGSLPQGELSLDSHGLIVICTGGMAQFDYDGQQIQLRKNDLYLYTLNEFCSSTVLKHNHIILQETGCSLQTAGSFKVLDLVRNYLQFILLN